MTSQIGGMFSTVPAILILLAASLPSPSLALFQRLSQPFLLWHWLWKYIKKKKKHGVAAQEGGRGWRLHRSVRIIHQLVSWKPITIFALPVWDVFSHPSSSSFPCAAWRWVRRGCNSFPIGGTVIGLLSATRWMGRGGGDLKTVWCWALWKVVT